MKAIILTRVSTYSQDLEQQKEKVMRRAISDGFSLDNIYILEDKESAVKLSEEERNGLRELKEIITRDSEVSCVYAWELSRISRQAKILYSIRDFLVERRIQLCILEPGFKVLKDDGSLDENSNIFFGIFSSLSENEGYIRKARFKRGKEKLKASNKFFGCGLLFGYTQDEEHNIIENPDEAKIIRKIYSMILSGNHTLGTIGKELYQTGEIKTSQEYYAKLKVGDILRNKAYTGEFNGTFSYPPLVSLEDYIRAREIIDKNRAIPKGKSWKDHVYYGRRILHDKTGRLMYPLCSSGTYKSMSGYYVSINIIDSVLWWYTSKLLMMRLHGEIYDHRQSQIINEEIESLQAKISRAEEEEYQTNSALERLEERYILGKIGKEKLNELSGRLMGVLKKTAHEKKAWEIRLEEIKSQPLPELLDPQRINDDQERYNIIKANISEATYDNITKTLKITLKNGYTENFILQGKPRKLYDQEGEPIEDIEWLKRYKRTQKR